MAELEQLIAADLTHPAIATPIATGIAGASAYLAQDFVAADSLDTHLRERRTFPPSEVVRILAQVAGALDVAASSRIVHGALHPRDLLVSPDDVRVTGVGIARALERVGTTAPVRRPYTAPERVGGRAWDRRADVFSLAVLAHEMLWGRRPSATGARAADALTDVPGADLAALRALFVRALAETFTDRFDSAERLVDALRTALGTAADAGEIAPAFAEPRRPPLEAAEPTRVAREAGARGLFDVDQFRETGELERLLPDPNLPIVPIEAPAVPEGDVDAVRTAPAGVPAPPPEVPAPAASAAHEPATSDAGDAPPPDAPPPRAPRKVVRTEPDRRPRTRDRLAPPDVRGMRAESSLFLETAESAAAPTASSAIAGPLGPIGLAPVAAQSDAGASDEAPFATLDRARSAVWPLVMALGIGIALGFAVGYGVGGRQRAQSVSPTAEAVAAPAPAESPRPAVESAAAPAAAAAQSVPSSETRPSEVPAASSPAAAAEPGEVTAPPPSPPPATAASAPPTATSTPRAAPAARAAQARTAPARSPRPSPPARTAPAPGPAAPSTATLLVDSRPAGASVYLDGRLIGTTPLSLPGVATGDHAVRIELAGYNQWTASVALEGGERRRVAASLER